MKDYLPFSLIPLLILFLCIPSIHLCSPFSHVFTFHACLPFIFITFAFMFVVHVQTPVLHLSPPRLPSMFKLPFGPLSAPTCPPCLHFLPSMLSSVFSSILSSTFSTYIFDVCSCYQPLLLVLYICASFDHFLIHFSSVFSAGTASFILTLLQFMPSALPQVQRMSSTLLQVPAGQL